MAAPVAPDNVTVSRAHDGRHTVSWRRNNSSAPDQFFTLQRWDNVTNEYRTITAVVPPQTSTVEDRGTVSNRQYSYRVRIANSDGASAWAYSVMFHTTPIYPTGVDAKREGELIRVTWFSNAPASCQYRVEDLVGGTMATFHLSPVNVRQMLITPSDPNVPHEFRVRATGMGPEGTMLSSTWSRLSPGVVIKAPPNPPVDISPNAVAADGAAPITLSWTHSPVDGSAQAGFTLQYGIRGTPVSGWTKVTQASTVQSYTIPAGTFDFGDQIEWQVRTRGAHPDLSPWSPIGVVDIASTPALTLTSPTAGAVIGGASLTMVTDYVDAGGDRITSRQVRLADADGVTLESRTTTMDLPPSGTASFKFSTTLADGEEYYALVRYRNSSGIWSDWASVIVTVDYTEPRPAVVSAVFDKDTGSTTVTYSHPNPLTGPGAPDHAEVWRRMPGRDWELMGEDLALSASVVDAIPLLGGTTEYRVRTFTALDTMAEAVTSLHPDVTGRVYFNSGDGFSAVTWLRHGTSTSTDRASAVALHPVEGRTAPIAIDGVQTTQSLTVNARLGREGATWQELDQMVKTPGVKVYRDCSGKRIFCSARSFSERHEGLFMWVTVPVSEVDYVE